MSNTPPGPGPPDDRPPGCAIILLLAALCLAGPLIALDLGGPWGGVGGSVFALLVWTYWGVSPLSGLLPGLLTMAIWLQGGGVLISCAIRLIRP